jgi:hypothetical protein
MANVEKFGVEELLEAANRSGRSNYGGQEYNDSERDTDKKPSKLRKFGKRVLIAAAIVTPFALFGTGVANGLAPHIDAHGGVAKGGHASVKEVSMKMPPITLATAETEITGEKVAFEEDFKALGFLSIPFNQQTITRDATVETLITLNPSNADISVTFDSDKNKLTYTLPDNTLATKVNIPTGKGRTSQTSGSITTFTSDMSSAMANSISGMFGNDASSVPLLGDVAQKKTSVTNALTSFADLAITTGVDQKCTPLIENIPSFTDQLKNNIKKVMASTVMASDQLPDLMNKPGTEIQKIIEKATVDMPANYKIGPDQAALDSFNKYLKSKIFSTDKNIPPIECGISKDFKLTLADNNQGSN